MTSAFLLCLCVLSTGDPESIPGVQECGERLRATLSAIRVLEIEYDESWESNANVPAAFGDLLSQLRDKSGSGGIGAESTAGEVVDPQASSATHPLLRSWRVVDALTRMRIECRAGSGAQEESPPELQWTKYIVDGRLTVIDESRGRAAIESLLDSEQLHLFPLSAIGRRLPGLAAVSLDALILSTAATTVLGRYSLEGIETICVQIGPDIPEAMRPYRGPSSYFMRVWLAPGYDWLPLRIVGYDLSQKGTERVALTDGSEALCLTQRFELAEFEGTRDELRGTEVMFPRVARLVDSLGAFTCRFSSVRINPPVRDTDFVADIPKGFIVSHDGMVPTAWMAGGGDAVLEAANGNVKGARALLADANDATRTVVLIVLNVAAAVVVAIAFLYRRIRRQSMFRLTCVCGAIWIASTGCMFSATMSAAAVDIPVSQAHQLRGGAWCTQHQVLDECDACHDEGAYSWKCSESGAKYTCVASSGSPCQECRLGSEADCGGYAMLYFGSSNCSGTPQTHPNCQGIKHHPNATSGIASGSCPDDCPSWGE